MENPWKIQSIYDLQYFTCPSCEFKEYSKQLFVIHASEYHPNSIEYLNSIADGSLNDIVCPWEIKTETLKTEDELLNVANSNDFTETAELKYNPNEQEFVSELENHVDSFVNNPNERKRQKVKQKPKNKLKKENVDKSVKNCTCDICGKILNSPYQLRNHVSSVHERVKKFHCDKCSYAAYYQQDLKHHVNNIHEGIKDFQCDRCSYATYFQ